MHQSRWEKQGKAGHFAAWPDSYSFHQEVAACQLKHNRLRLQQISLNERVIGYKYAYKLGKIYCAYLDARTEITESSRIQFYRLAFGEQLKEAMKENIRWIDSMRGRYEHKLHMGGKLFPVNHIYIYSKKFPLIIYVIGFRSLAWLLHIFYYKLWRARIAHRLKLKPRPFWKLWIRFHMLSY